MTLLAISVAPAIVCGQSIPADATITRASAILNGVYSPRGFFNITVRLYRLPGAEAAKYDLKKSRVTVDFAPGVSITEDDMRHVMADAGYKPGPVHIEKLRPSDATETAPGWVKQSTLSRTMPLSAGCNSISERPKTQRR